MIDPRDILHLWSSRALTGTQKLSTFLFADIAPQGRSRSILNIVNYFDTSKFHECETAMKITREKQPRQMMVLPSATPSTECIPFSSK